MRSQRGPEGPPTDQGPSPYDKAILAVACWHSHLCCRCNYFKCRQHRQATRVWFNLKCGSAVVWWLTPLDSGFRGQGFKPYSGRRVMSLSKTYLPPKKVLVIPRKRWLIPNMTEKLFTGTLSIKPNQTKTFKCCQCCPARRGVSLKCHKRRPATRVKI